MSPSYEEVLSRRREVVAREDLVTFINACFSSTGQDEFYSDAEGQRVSIAFLHRYILGNYRRLYARTLAAGINHDNQARIVSNLLSSPRPPGDEDRAQERTLIDATLSRLPFPRVLNLLVALCKTGLNNRRFRAVCRQVLRSRRDGAHDVVKYRSKIRLVLSHTHQVLPGELSTYVFRGHRHPHYDTPLLERARQAHYSQEAVFDLPFTVAEGHASRRGIPMKQVLDRGRDRMTPGEKFRLNQAARVHGSRPLDADLSRISLTRQALRYLALDEPARREQGGASLAAMRDRARHVARRHRLEFGRIAAVLDRSFSTSGSREKRRRPLAIALAVHVLLEAASREYHAFWTPDLQDLLGIQAEGQTDLWSPSLAALRRRPEGLFLVSDGHENDPPGAAAELFRVYRARFDPDRKTSIVHLNPVFDPRQLSVRRLGPAIPTVGIREAEDLPTLVGFAAFADGHAPLAALEDYLDRRVVAWIDPKRSPR